MSVPNNYVGDACAVANDRVIVLRGLGSRPGQVIALCFWAKNFNLTVPLSTQEYKGGLNGAMAFTANG